MKSSSLLFKSLVWIFRLIFGATFILSGITKLIDPLGTVYKIQDYLVAMNLDIFSPLAYIIAWTLFSAEFLCGMLILLGIRFKEGVLLGVLFMLIMTPLTLWIAITDPVTDCGCFGDAIVLTNWETFWKNIILSAIIIFLFVTRSKFKEWIQTPISWIIAILIFATPCIYSSISLSYLPIIDFRPYNIGANINEKMQIPEGETPDRYETTFIYEKDGIQEEFTFTSLPDSSWMFVEQRTKLVKKGYTPPIHDFALITLDGEDITYEVLDDTGRTYFCVMYDLKLTNMKYISKINDIYQKAQNENARFIALTSSYDEEIENFIKETNAQYSFVNTDAIQLKTMIRANPGIVVVENGVIVDKWNIASRH